MNNLFNTLKSTKTFEIVCRKDNAPGFTFWTVSSDYLDAHASLENFIKYYDIVQIKIDDKIVWSFVQSNSSQTRKLTFLPNEVIDWTITSYKVGFNPLPSIREKKVSMPCDIPVWIELSKADELYYSCSPLKCNIALGHCGSEDIGLFVGMDALTQNTMEDLDYFFKNYGLIITVKAHNYVINESENITEIKSRNFESWYALFLRYRQTGYYINEISFSFTEDKWTPLETVYKGMAYGSVYFQA